MTRFCRLVQERESGPLANYNALHAWSIDDIARFWRTYATYTGIRFDTPPKRILSDDPMLDARWFEGATLNYARALLEPGSTPSASSVAIIAVDEADHEQQLTWAALRAPSGAHGRGAA